MTAADPAGAELTGELIRAVRAVAGDDADVRFGVAVSGGPDSMALLDLSARAFPGRVEAATVDHGLRAGSAEEAAMVAEWCGSQAIVHVTLYPTEPRSGNLHQWARTQRYALLEEWRVERRIDWLFTAHHADDQLETMLMRLNRSSGLGGMAGIRSRQGHVVRPLLGVRRARLHAYAVERGLSYVEDPSNSDPRFDRAAIRSHLNDVDWLDPQAASRTAAALDEAEQALGWTVDMLEDQHVRPDGDGWSLDRTDLPREILRRLLLKIVARIDPAAAPRGDTIDRAILVAQAGGKISIGDLLLTGGSIWRVKAAPSRNQK